MRIDHFLLSFWLCKFKNPKLYNPFQEARGATPPLKGAGGIIYLRATFFLRLPAITWKALREEKR
jgi:hypothetical protein